MTTQDNASSPFGSSVDNQPQSATENFSFRTMQDDLLSAPKSDAFSTSSAQDQPKPSQEIKNVQPASELPTKTAPLQNEVTNSSPNPFLSQATPAENIAKEKIAEQKIATPAAKMVEVPTSTIEEYDESSNSSYKVIVITAILLTILIIGAIAYYFLAIKSIPTQPVIEQTAAVEEIAPIIEEPVVVAPPVEKYSAAKPNYLVIDPATMPSALIKENLQKLADEIENMPAKNSYEFVIVDTNNNPVAFPIFATASGLNLAPTILSSLGETFSLFIYNDNGSAKLGFSATINKAAIFATELQKQEKTLLNDISLLFLDAKPETTTGAFKDGSYKNFKTKYLNLNSQETLSIDYAISDNQFILSTNKDALRAILDKPVAVITSPAQESQASVDLSVSTDKSSTITETSTVSSSTNTPN